MPGVRSSQVAKSHVCQEKAVTPGLGKESQESVCEPKKGDGWICTKGGMSNHRGLILQKNLLCLKRAPEVPGQCSPPEGLKGEHKDPEGASIFIHFGVFALVGVKLTKWDSSTDWPQAFSSKEDEEYVVAHLQDGLQ